MCFYTKDAPYENASQKKGIQLTELACINGKAIYIDFHMKRHNVKSTQQQLIQHFKLFHSSFVNHKLIREKLLAIFGVYTIYEKYLSKIAAVLIYRQFISNYCYLSCT
jgi:hypothetical protein